MYLYKTIQQIYQGETNPSERCRSSEQQYREDKEAQYTRYETFREKLDDDMRQEFDQFMDGEMELENERKLEVFVEGFRLGGRVLLEVCQEEKPV